MLVKGFFGAVGVDVLRGLSLPPQKIDVGPIQTEALENGFVCYCATAPATDATEPLFCGRPTRQPLLKGNKEGVVDRSALAEVEGIFAGVQIFARSVCLFTDFIGAYNVYYYRTPSGATYFASEFGWLMDILPVCPEINDRGIAAHLAGSVCVEGQTYREGVKRLGAGEVLCISEDCENSTTTYFSLPEAAAKKTPWSRSRPYEQAIQAFDHHLSQAIAENPFISESALLLSGGLDSRAILMGSITAPPQIRQAVTFGRPRSTDMRGAQHVAAIYRLGHSLAPYEDDWTIEQSADFIISLGRGTSGLQVSHLLPGFERVWGSGANGAITGFIGDAITGAHLPADIASSSVALCFPILRTLKSDAFRDMFERAHQENCELISAREASYTDMSLRRVQQHMLTDLFIRQAARMANGFRLGGWYSPHVAPFVDKRLITFLLSLPDEFLFGQRLYRDWAAWKSNRLKSHTNRRADIWYRLTENRVSRRLGRAIGTYSKFGALSWEDQVAREESFFREVSAAPNPVADFMRAEFTAGNRHIGIVNAAGLSLSL